MKHAIRASLARARWTLALALAGTLAPALAAGEPPPFGVIGIPAASSPNFESTGGLRLTRTGAGPSFDLTVTGNAASLALRLLPTLTYAVDGSFTLLAHFLGNAMVGGSLSITGTVPGYDGPGTPAPATPQLLYRATLFDFGTDTVSDATPAALGFASQAATGWATQFTDSQPEGIYLYAFSVQSFVQALNSSATFVYTAPDVQAWISLGGPLPAVPEAPPAALLAAGLLVLAAWRRHAA